MASDSVSIFAEGTFEEQILELVTYVARNRPEGERAAFIAPFQESLKAIEGDGAKKAALQSVLKEVNGLGDGSEKEVEGFFNLLYAHIFALFTDAKEPLSGLLVSISSAPANRLPIAYRVLSNLFNTLPRASPLRNVVYTTILNLAAANDDLQTLQLSQSEVSKWLSEWDVSDDEKTAFLKALVDAYAKGGEPAQSYTYALLYVQRLPTSLDSAKAAASQLIADALRLPSTFDFDALFKLDAVISVKESDPDLFSLLQVFLNSSLNEYEKWQAGKDGVLAKHNLDAAALTRKIRLLTLASLASQHVGQNLPYTTISSALSIPAEETEKWTIDVIRAGLVWGKLSQNTQSLLVTRATPRKFEREQWEVLEKRLIAWKEGLKGVLEVVAGAKKAAGVQSA